MRLTAREIEILALVAQGYTDQEIGDLLGIRLAAVKYQLKFIYAKLDARNRAHAVYIAIGEGFII